MINAEQRTGDPMTEQERYDKQNRILRDVTISDREALRRIAELCTRKDMANDYDSTGKD